jgi:uncharacterized protein (TIGR00290 family)
MARVYSEPPQRATRGDGSGAMRQVLGRSGAVYRDRMACDPERPKTLLSWSSGKDSAWALEVLRREARFEVVGLLTTLNDAHDRVAMHAVRRELLEAQAKAAGLPLWPVPLPWPCSNEVYERRMRDALSRANAEGIAHVAFGDLFLEDVRNYRIDRLRGSGVEPVFPIWCGRDGTEQLAQRMIDVGLRAFVTCVDPSQLDASFAGRRFDQRFLAELPATCDPLGENGEFHTFCFAGPMFSETIPATPGDVVERDGFVFADLRLDASGSGSQSNARRARETPTPGAAHGGEA